MDTLIPISDLVDLLADEEIERLERRAWRSASAAWDRYHDALRRDDPLSTTNLLNEAAWLAEASWRTLYDEGQSRRAVRCEAH